MRPELSNNQGLVEASADVMRRQGLAVDALRAADHEIATGVWPDMTEHGSVTDEWPENLPRVSAADILVVAGPIWLGDNRSVTKRCIDPPQADGGWIGEAGPGPSYLDPGSGGQNNDLTNRNTTFMTWSLMHVAQLLKRAGGIPRLWQPEGRVGRRSQVRL